MAMLAGLAVCLAGCQTTPQVRRYAEALRTNDLTTASAIKLASATPVIDVHTHNFNARDIPIRNIALGRRDALPPWTWLISDDVAKDAAAVIVGWTEPDRTASGPLLETANRPQRIVAFAALTNATSSQAYTLTNLSAAMEKSQRHRQTRALSASDFSLKQSLYLRGIAATAAHQPAGFFRHDLREVLDRISPFLYDLTCSDEQLLQQYHQENSPNIQFRIAHMMDMGPTYGQPPHEAGLRSFAEEITNLVALERKPNAGLAYFVAYNPFRDNFAPGAALAQVKDALTNHGAYGVKVYPPAGYRPMANRIPGRPCCWFTAAPGREWDARYTANGVRIANADLDARLLELLCWCASNQVPVFAHSGYGEFQARDGYGQRMPDPRYWKQLLTNAAAAHPELENLRLCLAHSGGGASWFGDEAKFKRWSEDVVFLCRRFPNVYCEVGCLDEILDPDQQARFAATMVQLCAATNTTPDLPYPFAAKIMYGSDWFMPISGGNHMRFFSEYQKVFLLPELQATYRRFFLENALDYLDARSRIGSKQFPLDPIVKTRLENLMAAAK